MARIRSIKPEFFVDEDLQDLESSNLGAYCMLVFAGLWGHCSKEGVFEYRPRMLKLAILPFIEFSMTDTLTLLESAGFIRRFCFEGREYGFIPNFEKHQRISGKEAQYSPKLPTFTPEAQRGSNGEATGNNQGSEREAQEKEKEKEKDKPQQQREGVREGFECVLKENRTRLVALFPDVNLDVALEKLIVHCRGKPVLDPYDRLIRWLQNEFSSGGVSGSDSGGRSKASGGKAKGIIEPNGPGADWTGGSQFASG